MKQKGILKRIATLALTVVMGVSTIMPVCAAETDAAQHVAVMRSGNDSQNSFSDLIIKAAGNNADNVRSVVFDKSLHLSDFSTEQKKTFVDLSVTKDTRTGTTTDSTKSNGDKGYYLYHIFAWYDSSTGAVKIFSDADKVYANSYSSYLFADTDLAKEGKSTFKNLEAIDLSGIDWSNAVELQSAFYGLSNLKALDLSGYNFNIDAIEKYSRETYKMSSMCTSWMFAKSGITALVLPQNWRFLGSTGLSGHWAYKSNTGDSSKDGIYTSYDIEMPSGILGGGKGGTYVAAPNAVIDHTDAEKANDLEKVYWALEKSYNNIHEIHEPNKTFTAFCIDEYVGLIEGYYKKEGYNPNKETNGSEAGSDKTKWMTNSNKGYFDSEEGKRGWEPLGDSMEQALIALAYWGPQIYDLSTESGYKALQSDIYYFTDEYSGASNFKSAKKWEGHTYNDIKDENGEFIGDTYVLYVYVTMDGRQNMITTESVTRATPVMISKTDITGKKELENATLTITNKAGETIWTVNTGNEKDSDGNLLDGNDGIGPHKVSLVDGEYTLTEKTAPAGYEVAESINFKIQNGKIYLGTKASTGTITYASEAVTATAKDSTTGKNYPVVTMKDDYKTVPVTIKKVDPDGKGLGKILAETVTDEALEKADDTGKKTLGYDGSQARLRIKSISTTAGVTVDKIFYSQENGRTLDLYPGIYTLSEETAPIGYAKAASITFKVDDSGKLYFPQKDDNGGNKTDKNNNIAFNEMAEGSAVVTMTDALDTTPHDVYISKTDIYDAVKDEKTGKYTVNEIAGAELTITDKNGKTVEKWTSEAGKTHKASLPQGTYTLVEKSAPDGYKLANDITFVVDGSGNVSSAVSKDGTAAYNENLGAIVMKDDFANVKVKISKEDIVGKEIEGAELTITDKDGNKVESWTSKKNEKHETTLAPGTYTLTETTSPKGYKKSELITFTISTDGKGTITRADKTDVKDNTIVMTDAYEEHDVVISKQNTSKKEIGGALLTLSYTTTDSTGKTSSKTVTGAPWTTEEGKSKTFSLTPGTYTLHETTAPDGYNKASDIVFTVSIDGTVKITAGGSGTYKGAIVDGKIVMYDQSKTTTTKTPGKVTIKKVDSKTGSYVSGAKLQILDPDEKTVEEWTSNSGAHTVSATLTVDKKYTLREVSAPSGYSKAADITFTASTSAQTITMKDVPTETTSYTITVKKVDDNGSRVSGAKMQILDSSGNVVESWTTGNSDHTVSTKLTTGKTYYVHEESAPSGYEIASDRSFTYSSTQTITVVDKKKVTPTNTETPTTTSTTTNTTPVAETRTTVRDNPTGDASNLPLWIGIAAAACAGIGAVVVINKKKKKNN